MNPSLPWIPIAITFLLLAFPSTSQRWLARAGYFLMLSLLAAVLVQILWG